MATGERGSAPLFRVSAVLGNVADGDWPARLRGSRIDVLALNAAEAQRSRLRKCTAAGTDVAVGLARGGQLRDGDVLVWDEAGRAAVVVRVNLPDVMVVDLTALVAGPAETLLARSVELGHALGNQHWPVLVRGTRMYLPVMVAPSVMATVLKTHDIAGVSSSFAPGADILPQLSPHDAQLLFAATAGHSFLSGAATDEEAN